MTTFEDRRQVVCEMRHDGASTNRIAKKLGVAPSTVARDLIRLRSMGHDFGVLDKQLSSIAKERSATNPGNDPGRVAEVRATILEMRLQGHQPRDIAVTLGLSQSTISVHLVNIFAAHIAPNVDQLRALELERLDRYLTKLEAQIEAGDVKAITAATRISERRAMLTGANRPIQVDHTVLTIDVLDAEIARLNAKMRQLASGGELIEGEVVNSTAIDG